MKYIISISVICLIYINQLFGQTHTMAHRSDYESIGDEMYDLNDPDEGSIYYSITAGNTNGYYAIDPLNGKITIAAPISDTFNTVHSDTLTIYAGGTIYKIEIVDGYDYLINNLDSDFSVLKDHNEVYIDYSSEWSAYNNLWGKGSAVPVVDFRVATIHKNKLPDTTILLWDVPSEAKAFDGASVWCYNQVFWGNRKDVREDLASYPFKIKDKKAISLEFDFEKLFGNDRYAIAMNMFMTDESYLTNFSNNNGDFYFTFDQVGTWIPPYPYSLPDTTILEKSFVLLYDNMKNGSFYERRRVIIKNNERLMQGTLDIKYHVPYHL